MNLDELLGIDPNDPLDALAGRLVDADEKMGDELRQRRIDLGLSIEQVSKRMGVSPDVADAVERRNVDDAHLTHLYAMAVGVAIEHKIIPVMNRSADETER